MNALKLVVFFVLCSGFASAQSREKIAEIMYDYATNIGKPGYGHNYVDDRLNPALDQLQHIVCLNNDRQLLESFLEMMVATTGSANETPADVLAAIFVCQTEMVETLLKSKYKNPDILEMLDFGFKNIMSANKPDNHAELELRLASLMK